MVSLHKEVAYVLQPYSHLAPLARRLTRLGVKVVEAVPSEAPRLIPRYGCGLTPLPAVVTHNLPLYPEGPAVAARGDVPSVILVAWREGLDPCECRVVYATAESIASVTYLRLALSKLCEKPPVVTRAKVSAETRLSEGECMLLIGDEGLRAYVIHQLRAFTLTRLFRDAYGLNPVFAITAGCGCSRLGDALREASARARATMMDVLRVSSRLRVPLKVSRLYFDSISYRADADVVRHMLSLLSREASLLIASR